MSVLESVLLGVLIVIVIVAIVAWRAIAARRRPKRGAEKSVQPVRRGPGSTSDIFSHFLWPSIGWAVGIGGLLYFINPLLFGRPPALLLLPFGMFALWRGMASAVKRKEEKGGGAGALGDLKTWTGWAIPLSIVITMAWYFNHLTNLEALVPMDKTPSGPSQAVANLAVPAPPKAPPAPAEPYLAPIDAAYWFGNIRQMNPHFRIPQFGCDTTMCRIKIAPGGRVTVSDKQSAEARDVYIVFQFFFKEGQRVREEDEWQLTLVNGRCAYAPSTRSDKRGSKQCVGNWRSRDGALSGVYMMDWHSSDFFTVYLNNSREVATQTAPMAIAMVRRTCRPIEDISCWFR
jgi:hypothetical protein